MSISRIQVGQSGLVGVRPAISYIETNDTIATVITPGYLNRAYASGNLFDNNSLAAVRTKTSPSATTSQVGWYQIIHSGVNWSLTAVGQPGDVQLPTTPNHIATYVDANGTLAEDPTTAISAGNIQAGLEGTAGTITSYPSTGSTGYLTLAASGSVGDTQTIITNASMGQATTITIPDPGNSIGVALVAATATPFTTSHVLSSSGTSGLVVDSGIASSAVQLNTNIKASQVAGIGGVGATVTLTVPGILSTSVVNVSIIASSNVVSVSKVTPSTNTITILLSGDPGATLTISYVAFIAAQ